MILEIIKDDYQKSECGSPSKCLLARALNRVFNADDAKVSSGWITVASKEFKHTPDSRDLMLRFDFYRASIKKFPIKVALIEILMIVLILSGCSSLEPLTQKPLIQKPMALTGISQLRTTLANLPKASQTIQAASNLGGHVQVAPGIYELGDKPLLVPAGCDLDGDSWGRTLFHYTGKGEAIQLYSYATNQFTEGITIRNLSIKSDNANGIGVDQTNTFNVVVVRLENIILDCPKGLPLNLKIGQTGEIYDLRVESVVIRSCAGMAADIWSRIGSVNHLSVVNPTNSLNNNSVKALVQLEGNVRFENSWLEGSFNYPLLRYQGNGIFSHVNNWLEPHTLGVQEIISHQANVIQDRILFPEAEVPVKVEDSSRLTILEYPKVTDINGSFTGDIAHALQIDASSGIKISQ